MKKTVKQKFYGKYKNMKHFIEALLAIVYYRFPGKGVYVIGVTGTDGKTTTSSMIYHLLNENHKKVALINTIGAYLGNKKMDTGLHVTTPGSWFIQRFLRMLVDKKYEYVVLESTSHGLDQHRLLGANFRIGVLTNLTHEHLDYHGTMLKYAKSKAKLFRSVQTAIVNFKAVESVKFEKLITNDKKIVDYNLSLLNTYPKFLSESVKKMFPQKYNQLNAIAAIETCREVGLSEKEIAKSLQSFPGIPGRMEQVKNDRGVYAYIDFAHTPYSLHELLTHLRTQLSKGKKLIVVFGCAGDRDKEKRPMMGEIAAKNSDIIVLTAEDPRKEKVLDINASIRKGIRCDKNFKGEVYEENDRQKALNLAVSKTHKGDILVACGKGHEQSLNIGGKEYPWSEREALQKAFKRKT